VGHLCADLARRGWATVALEYRRIGDAGGGWPGTLTDVAAALDALPAMASKHGLDLGHAVWMGHSAGGQLALWAVTRPSAAAALKRPSWRPRRVVGLAPVSDLVEADRLELSKHVTLELLGGTAREQPARYADASPADHLPLGVHGIVHGTRTTPAFTMSRSFMNGPRGRGRRSPQDARDADHFGRHRPESKAWALVLDALGVLNASCARAIRLPRDARAAGWGFGGHGPVVGFGWASAVPEARLRCRGADQRHMGPTYPSS
jgi:hypothetical protein